MGCRTRDGGPIRILNIVDEYTRVARGSRVARSIGARDVIAEVDNRPARPQHDAGSCARHST